MMRILLIMAITLIIAIILLKVANKLRQSDFLRNKKTQSVQIIVDEKNQTKNYRNNLKT